MKAIVNGIRMDYSLDGKAGLPVLVLIHGYPFNRRFWQAQVAGLKGRFRILTYDLRGMGKSQLGPAPQPMEAYVDDLLALLDLLQIRRAALAGLSMGGYIALRAVQRDPQRFWALALCDTRADADSDEAKLKRAAGIKNLRSKGVGAYVRAMLPGLFAASTLERRPAVARRLLKIMQASRADGMANALSAMAGRTDSVAALPKFEQPVLVLVGAQDQLAPPALAKAMAAKLGRRGQFKLIPQAGHVSNLEQPQAFNRHLEAFLERAIRLG